MRKAILDKAKMGRMQIGAVALRRDQGGMTLIELMVAMLLGLLVSAGIIALFMATNQSNKTQNAMGRVQENGRFAIGRMEADLRMAGGMFRQTTVADRENWVGATQGALMPRAAIMVNATGFTLTDLGVDGRSPGWTAAEIYPVSASFLLRGYECSSGTCSPVVPAAIPVVGTGVGNRVRGSDVLSMRYLRGIGWKYTLPAGVPIGAAATLTLDTTSGEAAPNFANGDLALVSDCTSAPTVIRVSVAGAVLTPTALIQPTEFKPGAGSGACDARVFNFSRDFIAVSYWLQLQTDPNPAAVGRLIPTLMRSENGVAQEVAPGVERLDFLYGAAVTANGGMSYLDGAQVTTLSTFAACSPPSAAFARQYSRTGTAAQQQWREPACLWRSLRSIEVHALFNTVDDMGEMSSQDMAYWYGIDSSTGPVIPTATMPVTGLSAGRMMRREFMSLVSIRNGSI
jgi:type IV pilus assembly protein PilW